MRADPELTKVLEKVVDDYLDEKLEEINQLVILIFKRQIEKRNGINLENKG